MSWQIIENYIQQRQPDFMGQVHGVPVDEIRILEAACGIVLPEIYVNYLTAMGRDACGFRPFGATSLHDFPVLLAELADLEDYDQHYFKISQLDDSSLISQYNVFIDLAHSDGQNAPLVKIEDDEGDVEGCDIIMETLTLEEQLVSSAFFHFDQSLRALWKLVCIQSIDDDDRERLVGIVHNVCNHIGTVQVMSTYPQLRCYSNDEVSLQLKVSLEDGLLSVIVRGNEKSTVDVVVDQLFHALPDAF